MLNTSKSNHTAIRINITTRVIFKSMIKFTGLNLPTLVYYKYQINLFSVPGLGTKFLNSVFFTKNV